MSDPLLRTKPGDFIETQEGADRPGYESSRTSLNRWLDILGREHKTAFLFELEMWIKCFDRFFRIKNHPLSEQELKDIVRRDFTEELRIVRNATLRMSYLCGEIMNADSVGVKRFNHYIEGHLKRVHTMDSLVERLLTQPTPEDSLALLTESLADMRVLIDDLTRLSSVSFQSFTSMGKLINREIKRCRYIDLLMIYKFKPQYDRIENQRLSVIVKGISNDLLRQDMAKIFLEFYRLLRYLDFIQTDLSQDRPLKDSILIFTLINAEAEMLIEFLNMRVMKISDLPVLVSEAIDATVYALEMELRKVFGRELIGFVHLRQAPPIYAKVENSHGLLRDCFQQSIVSLAQVFDPEFDGSMVFDTFQTKLEQSLRLRSDTWRLLCHLRRFEEKADKSKVVPLIEQITVYRDTTLKYLMYKDWDEYERFLEEVVAARNLEELLKVNHLFGTFLETLLGQVNMRAVLANHPFTYPPLED
ncbi:MAG TPA: hypothetical protein PLB32_17955 [Acidobacteriota bacterium]|nr:hypothetical protein [Acidobacteriota bacterium]HNG94691.1 hypothetical protein [Acidobacteriota bacterium]HNH83442.1 hypothetical protein [Acidobacteriota bacterium]